MPLISLREDIKKPLEDYLPRLGTLTFQIKLGSMLDKTQRIQPGGHLGPGLGLAEAETAAARRPPTCARPTW